MVLTALKLTFGLLTHSLAIIASSVDSFFDILASLVNFFSLKASLAPPDKEHGYGHGKIESLASLFQASVICISSIFIIWEGLKRFSSPAVLTDLNGGLVVMAVSTCASIGITLRLRSIAKKYDSPILRTDALHYATDIYQNIGVLLAIAVISLTDLPFLDPLIALIIGLFICRETYPILKDSLNALTDRELPTHIRENITHIITSFPAAQNFHNLRTRKSGCIYFIDFHLVVRGNISLIEAHNLTHKIEHALHASYPQAEILIHTDPYDDSLEDAKRLKTVYHRRRIKK